MAKTNTIKIQDGDGFQIINSSDFDERVHKPVVGEGEIIVKPKDVEDAAPFLIDEKDFDEAAYERVNATNANVAEVARQVDRQTLTEKLEESQRTTISGNQLNAPNVNTVSDAKEAPKEQTPQAQLKRNQQNKK